MANKRKPIPDDEFWQMWADNVHIQDMAKHFNVSETTIRANRRALGLPVRNGQRRRWAQVHPDPTPEEIELRAMECRERHYAEKRREPVPTLRVWREQNRCA